MALAQSEEGGVWSQAETPVLDQLYLLLAPGPHIQGRERFPVFVRWRIATKPGQRTPILNAFPTFSALRWFRKHKPGRAEMWLLSQGPLFGP